MTPVRNATVQYWLLCTKLDDNCQMFLHGDEKNKGM